jgi:hypothetical protein
MIVKAKYYKEIEVTDDISKEEIERICKSGMPDRFDCMADEIDNEKPLEFMSWSYVDDKYYEPTQTKKKKFDVVNLIMTLLFAILYGTAWGIYQHSVWFGVLNVCLYALIWFPIQAMTNWVRKVNKFMKGDKG